MSGIPSDIIPRGAHIKVIGVGGGGGNAVNTMIKEGIEGVEFVSANTDAQSLRFSLTDTKIQVGKELTKGLGAGADPDVGRDAALEDRHEIQESLSGADMVFVTAGMGGGTGTGGAAIIAQIARELGALTVGVVTKPFDFEGKRRQKHAEIGIERLKENVDTLIVVPNQRLLQIATPQMSMLEAFSLADSVLVNAVRGISNIINSEGNLNVDFADVKTVMSSTGQALMGIGEAEGEGRAAKAAKMAISSPLLEDVDIEGATGILINIAASANLGMLEVDEACSIINQAAHEDATVIFGTIIDEEMGEKVQVTVIATGLSSESAMSAAQEYKRSQPLSRMTSQPRITASKPRYYASPAESPTATPAASTIEAHLEDDSEEIEISSANSNQEIEQQESNLEITENPVCDRAETNEKVESVPFSRPFLPMKTEVSEHLEGATAEIPDLTLGEQIEKNIDEALELATKIKENSEEDLDIPTFMRFEEPNSTVK